MRKRMMHEFELSCGLVKLNDRSMVCIPCVIIKNCCFGGDRSIERRICEVLLDLLLAYTFATSSSYAGQSKGFLQ